MRDEKLTELLCGVSDFTNNVMDRLILLEAKFNSLKNTTHEHEKYFNDFEEAMDEQDERINKLFCQKKRGVKDESVN